MDTEDDQEDETEDEPRPQVLRVCEGCGKVRNKWNAKPEMIDNIRFPSGLEARRYEQLKLLLAAGEISGLLVHHVFTVLEWAHDDYGNILPKVTWESDFVYQDHGKTVVEDVKGGVDFGEQKLKRRLLQQRHPDLIVRVVRKEDM
jgi:hypothetical protein